MGRTTSTSSKPSSLLSTPATRSSLLPLIHLSTTMGPLADAVVMPWRQRRPPTAKVLAIRAESSVRPRTVQMLEDHSIQETTYSCHQQKVLRF